MTSKPSFFAAYAAMPTFVLLWGSAAIFTRWGLDHATVFALLVCRYAIAFVALLILGWSSKRWLPEPGTRLQVAGIGFVMVGLYSICYFQSMAHGVTPGLIATLLGAQPILTLLFTERRFSVWRLVGLFLALFGLVLVVYQSLALTRLSWTGMGLALATLGCTTVGALMQKRVQQAPTQVLPLQYAVTLGLCLAFVPFQPFRFNLAVGFFVPLLVLGLVISVGAQVLLYRMIRTGNLVNVTSLFYLVPVVTIVLDFLILGNRLPLLAVAGMGAILGGLVLVFRRP
ncbi:EamA-like transporter family protein [compost metagenome]